MPWPACPESCLHRPPRLRDISYLEPCISWRHFALIAYDIEVRSDDLGRRVQKIGDQFHPLFLFVPVFPSGPCPSRRHLFTCYLIRCCSSLRRDPTSSFEHRSDCSLRFVFTQNAVSATYRADSLRANVPASRTCTVCNRRSPECRNSIFSCLCL